jgi:RNA polymerase sigma-70 factor (ECF subfamily)
VAPTSSQSDRADLHAHCYRMLASLKGADEALRETLRQELPRFNGGEPVRSALYATATAVCLEAVEGRSKRLLPSDNGSPAALDGDVGEPLAESAWIDPYPDAALGLGEGHSAPGARYERREAVELAFVAALQQLPPRQRAVLSLRAVLGFSAAEVAEQLGTTVPAVKRALQRARRTVEERFPGPSQQAALRSLGDSGARRIVERYINAWERGDVEALAALLTEDATFAMPPYAAWWRGRDVIAAFAAEPVHRYLPAHASGQLANAAYRWNGDEERYVAEALEVLTLDGDRVKAMTAFMAPQLFERFGLPAELSPVDVRAR